MRKADGSTVVTPPANVLDLPSSITREAPMYSDLKQKQIPVKALGVGDTLEFELAYINDKPLVPGQFWFSYTFTRKSVVLQEVLEIRVPRNMQPKIANVDLKPTITENTTERIYTWTTAAIEPTKVAPDADEPADLEKPSVQISTFGTWQQVGEWYGSLVQQPSAVTPKIQTKADSLTRNLTTDDERIEAIYDFVATKIRYISLSFGIGRYQPHSAEEVLENEYGDCKDKHTLLASLLKAKGIEAWPVLIHTSAKFDESVPSPAQFNHVITLLPRGQQYLWLDTTPEVAPYQMLLSVLRDKQSLAIPAKTAPFLIKTPANLPFANADHFDMRGKLNAEGTFTGHGDLTLRGDNEVIYRIAFHVSARAKWQEVMQAISYRLGFAGEVSNVQVDDPESTRKAFHLSWDYQRKKYGDWENRQISPPTGGMPINYIDEDKAPKSPIVVGGVGTTLYTTEMELPSGSSLDAPRNVDAKSTFAEYHAKYAFSNGKLICERRLNVLEKEVPIANWQKYVSFEKEIKNDFNTMIPVITPGLDAKSIDTRNNPEASALIEKSIGNIQNQQYAEAEDNLDKAKKLSPHQLNLNAAYGWLYLVQGKYEEGIQAYKVELREHPENLRTARWFAQVAEKMHREDDAIETYKTVLKTAPDDVDATSELGRLLVAKENWIEAQPVLEKAIKLRPDNAQVGVWYGRACLKNGKDAEGIAALKSAAAATTDASTLSEIAYAMADAGQGMDGAQTIAQRAVTEIANETSSLSLTSITDQQMKKMVEVAQIWDRMGWVAFKAGDLVVAEKYSLAAWKFSEDPIAGDHLGRIYERQGKLAAALDVYQLAQTRAYPVVPGLDERVKTLRKRVGATTSVGTPGHRQESNEDRLQNMRMVKFARTKPVSASADFLVLFVDGKVSETKMLGGDKLLEPLAQNIRSAKFDFAFPENGAGRIVRQGILSCSAYDPNCMFLMMLPNDATATSRSSIPIRAGETKVIQLHQ